MLVDIYDAPDQLQSIARWNVNGHVDNLCGLDADGQPTNPPPQQQQTAQMPGWAAGLVTVLNTGAQIYAVTQQSKIDKAQARLQNRPQPQQQFQQSGGGGIGGIPTWMLAVGGIAVVGVFVLVLTKKKKSTTEVKG